MRRGEAFLSFMIAAFACCAMAVVAIALWAWVWDAFR